MDGERLGYPRDAHYDEEVDVDLEPVDQGYRRQRYLPISHAAVTDDKQCNLSGDADASGGEWLDVQITSRHW